MKILLISDRFGWALDTLANQLRIVLGAKLEFDVMTTSSESFAPDFLRLHPRYDVVHFMANRAFFRWGWVTRRPCVFLLNHVHGGWKRIDENIRYADSICVSSRQWQDNLVNRYDHLNQDVHRIYFGIDTARFRPSPSANRETKRELGLDSDTLILGYSISKSSRKRVDRLWECIRALKKEQSLRFIVRLTGERWNENDIPDDISSNVILEGFLTEESMPNFYAGLDYYVCTSESEGGPYPVMESMSCGVTVLSTAVGVVPELVRDGENGFLLHEEDVAQSFVHAIRSSGRSKELRQRIGQHAREEVTKNFAIDIAIHASNYPLVYESASRGYSKRPSIEKMKKRLACTLYSRFRKSETMFRLLR